MIEDRRPAPRSFEPRMMRHLRRARYDPWGGFDPPRTGYLPGLVKLLLLGPPCRPARLDPARCKAAADRALADWRRRRRGGMPMDAKINQPD